MRIAILSRNPNLYSTRRLIQAARIRGHAISVIDTMSVAVEMGVTGRSDASIKVIKSPSSPIVPGRGLHVNSVTYLPTVDAIIPRIGASITPYGLAVVRQFEARGTLTTASSQAIAQSRNKLNSLQILSHHKLPAPRTAVVAQPQALYSAINAVGGTPVIIKLIQGTQGRGVLLVPNLATAVAVAQKLNDANQQALVQEFVSEAEGKDTRIIVVGNRCVAAMTRMAASGEFRANLHLGGTAEHALIDGATEQLALEAARAHGLSVAGVDIVRAKRGPLILEVNSSPGLEGIEQVTKIDVATEIIRFLESALSKANQQRLHKRKRRR